MERAASSLGGLPCFHLARWCPSSARPGLLALACADAVFLLDLQRAADLAGIDLSQSTDLTFQLVDAWADGEAAAAAASAGDAAAAESVRPVDAKLFRVLIGGAACRSLTLQQEV